MCRLAGFLRCTLTLFQHMHAIGSVYEQLNTVSDNLMITLYFQI